MNKKILVIEDDPGTVRLIKDCLQQGGYQVLTAPNGLEGIRKAKNEEPDLIILGVLLPGVDGFEICHRLRAEPKTAQLPVLMLSAMAREIDKATGLKVGADYYITKPAAPSEIANRVESLLAKKTAAKSEIAAVVGSKRGVGTTTLVVNVAIALSRRGKRVILADLCPYGGTIAEHLGLKPEHTITELLRRPANTINRGDLEAALTVHHTGVRVLAIPQMSGEQKEPSPSDVALLLEKLREVTNYLIVDLPLEPSSAARAILSKCDFAIIVTDSKAGSLSGVKSTATALGQLGITQERIGTVVIDREGVFPDWELSRMKSTVELRVGVKLLGVIPYDTRASLELVPAGAPVILSEPNCPMAWAMRGVAQHIIGEPPNNSDSS
jgi:DNA-binding response OmpR family regulator